MENKTCTGLRHRLVRIRCPIQPGLRVGSWASLLYRFSFPLLFYSLYTTSHLVVAIFAFAADLPALRRRQLVVFFLQPFRCASRRGTPDPTLRLSDRPPAAAGRPCPLGPGPGLAGPGRRGRAVPVRSDAVGGRVGPLPIHGYWESQGQAGPGRDGPSGRPASGPACARGFRRQAGSGCGAS
jgi:hypothetical protein